MIQNEIMVLAMCKDKHTYMVIYDEDHTVSAFRAIARFATNPDLNFNLRDALILIKRHYERGIEFGMNWSK
jgi:hypothetical protein